MVLPLTLLQTAQNHPMLVELKNGETYNGHLVSCDNWMNINLREVICTSREDGVRYQSVRIRSNPVDLVPVIDGDRFWRMPECYIRGSTVKYLRIPDEVIEMVKEETINRSKQRNQNKGGRGGPKGGRGGRGGRGGGRGGRGGRGGGRGGHHHDNQHNDR